MVVKVGTFTPGGRVGRLIVRSPQVQSQINEGILSGSMSLTTGEVSELLFTVSDSQGSLLHSGLLGLDEQISFSGLDLSVAAIAATETNGISTVEITARATGVQRLRRDRTPEVVNGVSPTDFVGRLATTAGLRFFGQPTPISPVSIVRGQNALASTGRAAVPGEKVESTWESILRIASDQGFIAFESLGILYFGQPTWLLDRAEKITVTWKGPGSAPGLLARPTCRRTSDDPLRSATVDLEVLGEAGEQFKPGMGLRLRGVPSFIGTFLISSVQINLDNTVPTRISAVYPVNPPKPGGGLANADGTGAGLIADTPITSSDLTLDQFLSGLRQHESGGDYAARPTNGRADGPSGAYQYIGSTWNNYHGYKYAWMAPAAIQDQRAAEDAAAALAAYGGDWRKVAVAHFVGSGNRIIDHPEEWDAVPKDSHGNPYPGNPTILAYVTDVMQKAGYVAPAAPATGGRTTPGVVSAQGFIWPVDGPLTSGFGQRGGRPHEGQDIGVPVGTPVAAAMDGRVTVSGAVPGYGQAIYIDHGAYVTRYGHLSQELVQVGQDVVQGQIIALSGNTGHSTGPHLHFEIRPGDVAANPLLYLPRHR